MASLRYWVWLSGICTVSPRARAAVAAHFGDAKDAFFSPAGDMKYVPGVSPAEAKLLEERDLSAADRMLGICEAEGIQVVTLADAAYPQRLRNIFAPPVALYIKGRLPDVDTIPSVAVIGTRKATPYGIKMGQNIAREIAASGAVVISGLTEGIDRAAAEGCLRSRGRCIGVLGTAHGRDTPLMKEIAARGALVSEYPPGTRAQNRFFRERNRVSAGLSHAVCVVEAPAGSGSLLFAREAVEQGREIFAVPGNADAENSAGIIYLLKQGARPAVRGWDVLEDYADIYPGVLRRPDTLKRPVIERKKPEPEKPEPPAAKKEIDKGKSTGYSDLHEQLAALSEDELRIVTAIDRGENSVDDLAEATGIGTGRLLAGITLLEVKGYIRRIAGGRVVLNISTK